MLTQLLVAAVVTVGAITADTDSGSVQAVIDINSTDIRGMTAGSNPDDGGLLKGSFGSSLGSCSYSATCTAGGYSGVCVSISAGCCNGGTTTSNLCPGSSDIKCCTKASCTTPYGSGSCMGTKQCSGTSYSGYCTGPSDLQCCVSGSPSPSNSHYGLDFASSISSSTMNCFAKDYSFVIPRGYHSTGSVDSQACSNIKTAKSAGISKIDSYMFPCPTCSKSATTQVNEMVDNLNSGCKSEWSGRVWLDIEGSQYWKGSSSANKAFYEELVDACKKKAKSCGVYSSASQWSSLFGSTSYSYGPSTSLPLWYAHYDNSASFSDFSSFGGWTSPHAKQYAGDVVACSTDVDKNYSPSF